MTGGSRTEKGRGGGHASFVASPGIRLGKKSPWKVRRVGYGYDSLGEGQLLVLVKRAFICRSMTHKLDSVDCVQFANPHTLIVSKFNSLCSAVLYIRVFRGFLFDRGTSDRSCGYGAGGGEAVSRHLNKCDKITGERCEGQNRLKDGERGGA